MLQHRQLHGLFTSILYTVGFIGSCGDLYLLLLFYATLVHTSILLLLHFYTTSNIVLADGIN